MISVAYGGRKDCNAGWVDRKGAGLLGNQPESCWDEGCQAGCQMFVINSGSSELPVTEGPPARTAVWLQPAVLSRLLTAQRPQESLPYGLFSQGLETVCCGVVFPKHRWP